MAVASDSRSPYSVAIDAARDTIVERARYYKWLVIVVSLGTLMVLASSAWWQSGWPLLILGGLPVLVLLHRIADLRAVQCWRDLVLAQWMSGTLDLPLLVKTLNAVPGLPALTLQGMVEALPSWESAALPPAGRPAMLRAQQAIGRLAVQALAVRALAWSVAATSMLGVVRVGGVAWWTAAPMAVALVVAWSRWSSSRLPRVVAELCRSWQADVGAALRANGDFLPAFNWQGVPARQRLAWDRALQRNAGGS